MNGLLARMGIGLGLVWMSAQVVARGQTGELGADQSTRRLTPYIYGARQCASCHGGRDDRWIKPEERRSFVCQLNEFLIFDARDKHRLAFQALTGDSGRLMGAILKTDVTRLDSCVNCHSVPSKGIDSQLYVPESDGVSCVACHGAYAEWVESHQRASGPWRSLSRRQKEKLYGMNDLWDPARRAEICASCHVGNYAEGKILTHAMYVAGHPPLPGVETATFSNAEPRHWQTLAEKQREGRQPPTGQGRGELEQTRLVVAGAVVNLKTAIQVLADQARHGRPGDTVIPWPDFARFDCSSCHHELTRDQGASARQLHRRGGPPGRPALPDWALALAGLGFGPAESESAPAFAEAVKPLVAQLQARPFGAGDELVKAADKTVAALNACLARLASSPATETEAAALLDQLCKLAKTVADFDSARQIAWAFREIYSEINPPKTRDPKILRELHQLTSQLDLDLAPSQRQTPITPWLSQRLRIAAGFDASAFQASFERIARRLVHPPRTASR